MSTRPEDARAVADDLTHGIDPAALGHEALGADIRRATDAPGARQLDAGCVRAAYEAIAATGERTHAANDSSLLVSLRSGARAAADAARVGDEIGAGAGTALRAAARAWYPYAMESEAKSWQAGLKAFSATCDSSDDADQLLIVRAVQAASAAAEGDDTATSRATRVFSDELQRRIALGEDLPIAWSGAARRTAENAPEPVFQTVVDAVEGVLRR